MLPPFPLTSRVITMNNGKHTSILLAWKSHHLIRSRRDWVASCWWILKQDSVTKQTFSCLKCFQSHIKMMVLAFKAVSGTAFIYLQTWSSDQCQDSRVTRHLPQKTKNSLVQTSFWPPHSMKIMSLSTKVSANWLEQNINPFQTRNNFHDHRLNESGERKSCELIISKI